MCQALGYHRLSRIDPKSDPLFNRKVSDPKQRDLTFLAGSVQSSHQSVNGKDVNQSSSCGGYPPLVRVLF